MDSFLSSTVCRVPYSRIDNLETKGSMTRWYFVYFPPIFTDEWEINELFAQCTIVGNATFFFRMAFERFDSWIVPSTPNGVLVGEYLIEKRAIE
uniref:Uncharacterized protein n=1 Tax=Candidatus Kentrum sp. LFY TaxID=2126342 RepID=A0A450WNT3_9GAMM|nr:MAG: hypothetical protein BECKLFY1418C_GA0070996_104716 [Candidatus Kentron sp. LFY]